MQRIKLDQATDPYLTPELEKVVSCSFILFFRRLVFKFLPYCCFYLWPDWHCLCCSHTRIRQYTLVASRGQACNNDLLCCSYSHIGQCTLLASRGQARYYNLFCWSYSHIGQYTLVASTGQARNYDLLCRSYSPIGQYTLLASRGKASN